MMMWVKQTWYVEIGDINDHLWGSEDGAYIRYLNEFALKSAVAGKEINIPQRNHEVKH